MRCRGRSARRAPAATAGTQQRCFARFCREYSRKRPHEALSNEVPADRYTPSARRLPMRLPIVEYPGHFDVRRVTAAGQVSWAGTPLFLSLALVGEDVAFEEVDDGLWTTHDSARYNPLRHSHTGGAPPMTRETKINDANP